MAAFLLLKDISGPIVKGFFWLMVPIATALGFALGAIVGDRITRGKRESFRGTLLWPLAGCVLGAIAIYWRGPMLIVFGMFGLGTVSIILREWVIRKTKNKHQEIV